MKSAPNRKHTMIVVLSFQTLSLRYSGWILRGDDLFLSDVNKFTRFFVNNLESKRLRLANTMNSAHDPYLCRGNPTLTRPQKLFAGTNTGKLVTRK